MPFLSGASERDSTFVVDDALIYCYLLVNSESGLKHRAQAVEERLDLAVLGGTIWISYMPKIWKN